MTRADLKHCGKIPDAREELNRSVRSIVVPLTSVEVTDSDAMLALCFSTLPLNCLMKRLGMSVQGYILVGWQECRFWLQR